MTTSGRAPKTALARRQFQSMPSDLAHNVLLDQLHYRPEFKAEIQ
jgi:hypothetical protein